MPGIKLPHRPYSTFTPSTRTSVDYTNSDYNVSIEVNNLDKPDSRKSKAAAVVRQPSSSLGNVVNVQSPTPVVAQEGKPDPENRKPRDFVMTSCCIVFACNFIAGLIAYHFGVKSSFAWKLGQLDVAKRNSKRALAFIALGVVAGLVTYGVVFYMHFVVNDKGWGSHS